MPAAAQLLSGGEHLLYEMSSKIKIANQWSSRVSAAAVVVTACAVLALAQSPQSASPPQQSAPSLKGQQQPAPPPTPDKTEKSDQGGKAEQAEQAPTPFRIRTEEVLVPVLVRNHSGEAVLNLGKKDFRLLEDDIEQRITSFSNDPFPLSIVFLVDDDLSQRAAEMVDRSLLAVLGGMAETDEMAVVLFAQFPRTVADFGSDQDKLRAVLKRTDLAHKFTVPAGPEMSGPVSSNNPASDIGVPQSAKIRAPESKGLDDAVLYCGDMLHQRPRDRRKLLLIVSDGRNSHNNTASFGQALRSLLSSDVSVYGVGVSEAVLDRKRAAIGRYVDATGGDIFYAAGQRSLEEDYTHILEESRNRYTLAYAPAGTDRSKEFHQIEVRVERPGLKVTARDGYFVLVAKK